MRLFLITVAALAIAFLADAQTVVVDATGANTGDLQNGVQFGKARTRSIRDKGGKTLTVSLPPQVGFSSNQSANPGGNQFGLDLFTAGNPRLSITPLGRVGIGTRQPSAAMHLNQFGDVELGLQSADTGGHLWTLQSSAVVPGGARNATFQIIDRTVNQSRFQIDLTGRVSVGVLQITGGADLAEPFPLSDEDVKTGSVLVIDEDNAGRLKLSSTSYDRRVAGVLSGAGGVHPALTMTQLSESANHSRTSSADVALSGRVYVWADADSAPIRPGDLLTTSSTPGHCMKAMDFELAKGAILGKAMTSLESGKGLVLALVTLQ